VLVLGQNRTQAFGDHGKAKICDPCTTGGVYEDVPLGGYQYWDEARSRITHSLEIPVSHIAGVEEVEAFGDIR